MLRKPYTHSSPCSRDVLIKHESFRSEGEYDIPQGCRDFAGCTLYSTADTRQTAKDASQPLERKQFDVLRT